MRSTNWTAKLDLFVEEKRDQPFSWTVNNCAFFTADWLAILLGYDLAEAYRDLTEPELKHLFNSRSFPQLIELVMAHHNWPQVTIEHAARGDVVAASLVHGKTLGVCTGINSVFPGERGILFHPTLACNTAWRIN